MTDDLDPMNDDAFDAELTAMFADAAPPAEDPVCGCCGPVRPAAPQYVSAVLPSAFAAT